MRLICVIDRVVTPLLKGVRQEDQKDRHPTDVHSVEHDSMKEFFQGFQEEYGRCLSKMYQERGDDPIHIGWVFEKKDEYYDRDPGPKKYFIQETWVSLSNPCEECSGSGRIPHEIIHPSYLSPEQECSTPENPL